MFGAESSHGFARFVLKLLSGIVGWLVIAPVAFAVPKRRDWIAVIGRDNGKFLDNTKYFFLQARSLLPSATRMVFVTERRDVVALLAGSGCEVLIYPSFAGTWFLLRAGTLIVDSSEWVSNWRRFLLAGAKKIQLWHGVGYKRIELDKWKNEAHGGQLPFWPHVYQLRKLAYLITGRLLRYDVVNTTSQFYRDRVFEPAFAARQFLVAGYPRNTFGCADGAVSELAWKNTDPRLAASIPEWHRQGRRIILLAPTFRDAGGLPMNLSTDSIMLLENWCRENRAELVFKFHPVEKSAVLQAGQHLHVCDPDSDLYPLMPYSSALVTDYSSIYMDYLLLDRPVLFFVPDLDEYVRNDRQFQFDFLEMTPGPKPRSWRELIASLSEQLQHDSFSAARLKLKSLAFENHDQHQAVPKLIALMRSKRWIPDADTGSGTSQ